jgi:hypothetical protein
MTKIPSLFPSSSQQGLEFRFDLIPDTRPTLLFPYHLTWPCQEELKKHLDVMLSKV